MANLGVEATAAEETDLLDFLLNQDFLMDEPAQAQAVDAGAADGRRQSDVPPSPSLKLKPARGRLKQRFRERVVAAVFAWKKQLLCFSQMPVSRIRFPSIRVPSGMLPADASQPLLPPSPSSSVRPHAAMACEGEGRGWVSGIILFNTPWKQNHDRPYRRSTQNGNFEPLPGGGSPKA